MTELERMAIRQAVDLLQKVAVTENRSLYSVADDYSNRPAGSLFTEYIAEDEWWVADHLTKGIIDRVASDLHDLGWKMPE